ncbi:MAG: CBS domain-containing protein [Verrucomicrobiales bacterium]
MKSKGSEVWTTTADATVYEAIGLMGEKNVGALVVVEKDVVVGVLSERDYSRKIVLEGRTSRDTKVGEILNKAVRTVRLGDCISVCMEVMTADRVRHLPVIEDGRLVGLISMGDLVRWAMDSQEDTIKQLHGYIAGEYPG